MVSMSVKFSLFCTKKKKKKKKLSYSKGAQDVADKTPFGGAIKGKPSLLNHQDLVLMTSNRCAISC